MMAYSEEVAAYRRARINKLKKIIIRTITVMVLLPIFLCIFLFFKLVSMNKKIDLINEKILGVEELFGSDNIEDQRSGIIIEQYSFDWQDMEEHTVDIEK